MLLTALHNCDVVGSMEIKTYTQGNTVLRTRIGFGHAARRNRARYAGQHIHRLVITEVVGIVDESIPALPRSFEAEFRRTRKPVVYVCVPQCGCTQGQHAGAELPVATVEHVTCAKCIARANR
jgi:hypothetical protein